MNYWEEIVSNCIHSGTHLTECDKDGYCDYCGYQETVEEFNYIIHGD